MQVAMAAPLPLALTSGYASLTTHGAIMGINNERDIEANIQIGPTDLGMVRIFVEGNGFEIPMDFEPEEAEEIAEEILAAAKAARSMTKKKR